MRLPCAPNYLLFFFLFAQSTGNGLWAGSQSPDAQTWPWRAGEALSGAQLANQVHLRSRAAVARYYDGALVSDDELAPGPTRDICLRLQARPCSHPGQRHDMCWLSL